MKRWPLFLIALPAAVAVWSGWVGLGQLCGFGLVQPFPGIVSWHLNTAITLPVGVESYGAYALGAWLTPGTPGRARTFARRSAVGALALGMLGQVVYHLLAAAHATRAPWPVVVLVACLPVVTLGFGAALAHLLRETTPGAQPDPEAQPETASEVHPAAAPAPAPASAPRSAPKRTRSRTRKAVTAEVAEVHFADDLAERRVPSARRIKSELHIGQPRANEIREHLGTVLASANGHHPGDDPDNADQ
jgi:hypothetical protein